MTPKAGIIQLITREITADIQKFNFVLAHSNFVNIVSYCRVSRGCHKFVWNSHVKMALRATQNLFCLPNRMKKLNKVIYR